MEYGEAWWERYLTDRLRNIFIQEFSRGVTDGDQTDSQGSDSSNHQSNASHGSGDPAASPVS